MKRIANIGPTATRRPRSKTERWVFVFVRRCAFWIFVTGSAIAASSDYDGNGKSDILWKNAVTGQNWLYLMNGASIDSSLGINTISDLNWQIIGNGDYDGDNKSDILWRNSASGQNWLYLMNGASIASSVGINTVSDPSWRIVGDGDYDGDNRSDILWRNAASGQNWLYLMNGANIASSVGINTISDPNWQVVGNGDYNGDGKSDILWRNALTGQIWLYLMNGATIVSSDGVNTISNLAWQIVGNGDYNGDGKSDILLRNALTGQNWLYLMNGANIDSSIGINTIGDISWQVAGNGDYNGDGKSDILWRDALTGQNWLYVMNGASITSSLLVNTIPPAQWVAQSDVPPIQTFTGLSSRPSNVSCIAPDEPTTNASIDTEEAFEDLPPLVKPVALLQAPGDDSQWYVVEQDGRVLRFENSPTVSTVSTFIDIRGPGGPVDVDSSENESGLLGMAFHPNYAVNRQVFLSYTEVDTSGTYKFISRVTRFTSNDDGLTLDPNSEDVLLSLDQTQDNHNGGNIVFGPDGFLYIGFGDGGGAGDPPDRAQNTSTLYGSMLRIDVDGGIPYGIPETNPNFGNLLCDAGTGAAPCPEIYAWGLRNPWRWSFDSLTGDLWLGDVGQSEWEEIDIVELGGNYGWRCREGAHDFNTTGTCPAGLIDPIIEYDHDEGKSVTGGFIYRGTAIPELIGRYVFGDFNERKIFASTSDGQGGYGYEVLLNTFLRMPSFAEEANRELLLLNYLVGDIHRIVQASGSSVNTIPDNLSDTGCVDSADPTQPAPGLIPYEINVPFWSDGAVKERFYAIPDGTTVDVDTDGDWLFPIGSVLMKNFRLNNELFETRLFMRHTNGVWAGYTYEWNPAGTDATRVVGGKVKDVQGQSWTYPSESQCMNCHTQTANFSLGIEHGQLNKDFRFPTTGLTANQLFTADVIDVLTDPLPDTTANLPRFANPADTTEMLESRARAYLHTNCAGCHRPLGLTPSSMDLRYSTALSATNTCNVAPASGDLGVVNARLISPGNAAASIIPNRMNRRDVHGMPPLGSAIPDSNGVALITQWIDNLTACP